MQRFLLQAIGDFYPFFIDGMEYYIGYDDYICLFHLSTSTNRTLYSSKTLEGLIKQMESDLDYEFEKCFFRIEINITKSIENYSTKKVSNILNFRPSNELYPEDFMAF